MYEEIHISTSTVLDLHEFPHLQTTAVCSNLVTVLVVE
jgi:hypothetical protein